MRSSIFSLYFSSFFQPTSSALSPAELVERERAANANAQRLLQELDKEKEEAAGKNRRKSQRRKKNKAPMDDSVADSEAGAPASPFCLLVENLKT